MVRHHISVLEYITAGALTTTMVGAAVLLSLPIVDKLVIKVMKILCNKRYQDLPMPDQRIRNSALYTKNSALLNY